MEIVEDHNQESGRPKNRVKQAFFHLLDLVKWGAFTTAVFWPITPVFIAAFSIYELYNFMLACFYPKEGASPQGLVIAQMAVLLLVFFTLPIIAPMIMFLFAGIFFVADAYLNSDKFTSRPGFIEEGDDLDESENTPALFYLLDIFGSFGLKSAVLLAFYAHVSVGALAFSSVLGVATLVTFSLGIALSFVSKVYEVCCFSNETSGDAESEAAVPQRGRNNYSLGHESRAMSIESSIAPRKSRCCCGLFDNKRDSDVRYQFVNKHDQESSDTATLSV